MMPNYYAILNVSASASAAEIKRAYRRLVRLHHPDLNAQAQDEEIKRLNEAYAVLSDTRKRAAYDELRHKARERTGAELRAQEEAAREPKMTWAQGAAGFVRELKAETAAGTEGSAQEKAAREPKLTWAQGVGGFVRELKKGLRDE